MSDWFDRTDRMLDRLRDEQYPLLDWQAIVRMRCQQADMYFAWVSGKNSTLRPSAPKLIEAPFSQTDRQWAAALQVSTLLPPPEFRKALLDPERLRTRRAHRVEPWLYRFDPADPRALLPFNDVVRNWFSHFHAWGHQVSALAKERGRFDWERLGNPYPLYPKPKNAPAIPDSDRWITERYPALADLCWQQQPAEAQERNPQAAG